MSKIKFIALTDESSELLVKVLERSAEDLANQLQNKHQSLNFLKTMVYATPSTSKLLTSIHAEIDTNTTEYLTIQNIIKSLKEVPKYVN